MTSAVFVGWFMCSLVCILPPAAVDSRSVVGGWQAALWAGGIVGGWRCTCVTEVVVYKDFL